MVAEVAKALQSRLKVCSVMVDRICTSREVSGEGLQVSCEPFEGEMVVHLKPSVLPNVPPPFDGDNVRLPDEEVIATYFYKRKVSKDNSKKEP